MTVPMRWRILLAALLALLIPLAVAAWTAGLGPFHRQVLPSRITPVSVLLPTEGADPRGVWVLFPWPKEDFCAGQFAVTAQESVSTVVVSDVSVLSRGGDCPGGGTIDGRAAAILMLESPHGDRRFIRASDGQTLPPTSR